MMMIRAGRTMFGDRPGEGHRQIEEDLGDECRHHQRQRHGRPIDGLPHEGPRCLASEHQDKPVRSPEKQAEQQEVERQGDPLPGPKGAGAGLEAVGQELLEPPRPEFGVETGISSTVCGVKSQTGSSPPAL